MSAPPRVLVIYHSQSGNTARLAEAVLTGARRVAAVETVLKRAFDAGVADLARCRDLGEAMASGLGLGIF